MKNLFDNASSISIIINSRYYVLSIIGAHIASSIDVTPIVIDRSSSYIAFENFGSLGRSPANTAARAAHGQRLSTQQT